jgi:hypothetical protein
LGERFLFYRLETHEDDREAIADVALGNSGPALHEPVELALTAGGWYVRRRWLG